MPVSEGTSAARVVYSGTIGDPGHSLEIFSTGFWLGQFATGASGGTQSMDGFNPAAYLDKAAAFGSAIMANAISLFNITLIKVNVFEIGTRTIKGVARHGLYQTTNPTVERAVAIPGNVPSNTPFTSAFGWELETTSARKGPASHGRMFLPGQGVVGSPQDPFDAAGGWSTATVTAVSNTLTPAWSALVQAGPTGEVFQPALIAVAGVRAAAGRVTFDMNPADVTIAEHVVWSVASRKDKLPRAGVRTTHAAFVSG